MNREKDQPSQIEQRSSRRVAIICGSILFLGGILMGWGMLNTAPIVAFWPGLVIGFCATLLIFYSITKALNQKKPKSKPKDSLGSRLSGAGAGLGVLILALFRDNEVLMINISGAAVSLMIGIGLFTTLMALRGKTL